MARDIRLRELLVGIEGLAVLRRLVDGADAEAERRLREIGVLVADERLGATQLAREAAVLPGYEAWAETYDEPGNPIVALEQPAVWTLLDGVPPGRALDAACGTGRHAAHLVDLGHEALGIDLAPRMVERAAKNVPHASFLCSDLRRIPAPDAHFDLVVCGLALSHLAELQPAVNELGRVLTPGGRLVVSILHPLQVQLGAQARFTTASGERRFIREHPHTHADYLAAFRSAALAVGECLEPAFGEEHVCAMRRIYDRIPDAAVRAYVGLPAVLVWGTERRPQ